MEHFSNAHQLGKVIRRKVGKITCADALALKRFTMLLKPEGYESLSHGCVHRSPILRLVHRKVCQKDSDLLLRETLLLDRPQSGQDIG